MAQIKPKKTVVSKDTTVTVKHPTQGTLKVSKSKMDSVANTIKNGVGKEFKKSVANSTKESYKAKGAKADTIKTNISMRGGYDSTGDMAWSIAKSLKKKK